MCGKPLVRFDTPSPFSTPRLGTPIYVASLASGDVQPQLRTWVLAQGELKEAQAYGWRPGRLDLERAACITAAMGDQCYNLLLRYVGAAEVIRLAP